MPLLCNTIERSELSPSFFAFFICSTVGKLMGIELGVSCAHVSMTLAGVGLTVLDFTADNHASNINARTLYTLSRQRQLHGMPVDPILLLKQVRGNTAVCNSNLCKIDSGTLALIVLCFCSHRHSTD